jgi:FAD/FMN-containing dehydrogenase
MPVVLLLLVQLAAPGLAAQVVVNDVSGLNPTTVAEVRSVHSQDEVIAAIESARKRRLHVSFAGARHSQGGHISSPGNSLLDMAAMDRVISVDRERQIARVEPGVTWEKLQEYR